MSGIFGSSSASDNNSTNTPAYTGLSIQTSAKGVTVSVGYGQFRAPGNLIWYGNFQAVPHTQSQESGGGKGGGGGGSAPASISYTYTAGLAFGLCQGPIYGVLQIWKDKAGYSPSDMGFDVYPGSSTQNADPWLSGYVPAQALSYRGLAYAIGGAIDLGSSANTPQFSWEVAGLLWTPGAIDVNPADVLLDLLPNTFYGPSFPQLCLGTLAQFKTYCTAAGFAISPLFDSQTQVRSSVQDIVKACNAGFRWSQGILEIIPYCVDTITANGVTFTPQGPAADLTEDDLDYEAGEDPIKVTRKRQADTYNLINVEYLDRSNQYNPEVASYSDLSGSRVYGIRPASTLTAHFFCAAAPAALSAQLLCQREHVRNTYEFAVQPKWITLDVMDIVTITDARLGLDAEWVRITEMTEDDQGKITITAEDCLRSSHTKPLSGQTAGGGTIDQETPAPSTETPVIFEPPAPLCGSPNSPEVWMGVAGLGVWGGCNVWVSLTGDNYKCVGSLNAPARIGSLTAALPSGGSIDTTDTASVLLDLVAQTLASCTAVEASSYATLCYVDGEFLAFQNATLTAPGAYNLTNLYRGAYGTGISAHSAGGRFARCDGAIFKYPFSAKYIGQTMYIKFQSFNVYGKGLQDLADCTAYQYNLVGGSYSAAQSATGLAVPAAGAQISYKYTFPRLPIVLATIKGSSPGDYYVVQQETTSGCVIHCLNNATAYSNFLTGGTASADSTTGSNLPAYAADGNTGTQWLSGSGAYPHWWKYDLGSGNARTARSLTVYTMVGTATPFTLEGSNTGAFSGEQTALVTGTVAASASPGTQVWYFDNSTAYRYYRFIATAGDSGGLAIAEIGIWDGPQSVARTVNWLAATTVADTGSTTVQGWGGNWGGTWNQT